MTNTPNQAKPTTTTGATKPGGMSGTVTNSQKPIGTTTNTVNTKPVPKP